MRRSANSSAKHTAKPAATSSGSAAARRAASPHGGVLPAPSDAPESTLSRVIRREFFARAGVPAARYGIDPDAVVQYCSAHRPASPLSASRMIVHLEDLTHVVACLSGVGLAWSDLIEAHEPALLRIVRDRLDDQASLVAVRRWFMALRRHSRGGPVVRHVRGHGLATPDPRPTIGGYPGIRPLRHWLAERLLAELAGPTSLAPGRPLRLTGREFGVSIASTTGRSPFERGAPSRSAR